MSLSNEKFDSVIPWMEKNWEMRESFQGVANKTALMGTVLVYKKGYKNESLCDSLAYKWQVLFF